MTETVEFILEGIRLRPWLMLVAISTPYFLLAYTRRIYPHAFQVLLLSFPVALTLLAPFFPASVYAVAVFDGIILLAVIIDLITLPPAHTLNVQRTMQRVASLDKDHPVTLTVGNASSRQLSLWLRDDTPQDFDVEPNQFLIELPGKRQAVLSYTLRAKERGAFQLRTLFASLRSRLGLWQRFFETECESTLHVYPDMKQLAEYEMLARLDRLSLMGVRRTRRVGQDHDFERLRDFTRDDNFKHIDWRTTARRNKLTVRDFQSSQSQRVMFLVDCGRMMTNEAGGLTLLDHALNSMLMMSYVALKKGDAVGLICFSDEIHKFVPPRAGMNQLNQLLHASFDRFPRLVESRYDDAFVYLATRCPKRSLVTLITNVVDEINAHQIEKYLTAQSGRHLPMGVLLRDRRIFEAANAEQPVGPQLFRSAAAAEILTWRQEVLTDLEHKGVLTIDAFPEELTAPMVNQYLEVKARHLL